LVKFQNLYTFAACLTNGQVSLNQNFEEFIGPGGEPACRQAGLVGTLL